MKSVWFFLLLGSFVTYHGFTTVSGEDVLSGGEESQPSYSQCKPYVDAALKGETTQAAPAAPPTSEAPPSEPTPPAIDDSTEDEQQAPTPSTEQPADEPAAADQTVAANDSGKSSEEESSPGDSTAPGTESNDAEDDSKEAGEAGVEADDNSTESDEATGAPAAAADAADNSSEDQAATTDAAGESDESSEEAVDAAAASDVATDAAPAAESEEAAAEADAAPAATEAATETTTANETDSEEEANKSEDSNENEAQPEGTAGTAAAGSDGDSGEDSTEESQSDAADRDNVAQSADEPNSNEQSQESQEQVQEAQATTTTEAEPRVEEASAEETASTPAPPVVEEEVPATSTEAEDSGEDSSEEDDSQEAEPSYVPRSREHLERILGLDESESTQGLATLLDKATLSTLKELKTIYETAIKPLETLYKYRDLSNRHFGDPEIFSKPMVVFMGPWSGGKSTILNWLLGIENQDSAIRTGADPSPAQFNIMTHGSEDEVLDGTQLAADWTFSGLQKFGQAFLDRLRGRKLPNRLLEKVNLVEIPGILEVRKQVERSFPFNDACQWFIDRADVLFLVYDPAKLDIGPETEAILDQLKGRENQVRIVLNKADTVKPDELLRLQANLIWNISPLMASAEPPTLYVASLWGRPLNPDSPTSLLVSHENHFLKDIRDATEKRVETRIASARRFAVRVRNHGKMCDCYLNTYNNHRSFFSNKKKISDDIIEHPQNYHIYEGLSTLTNISRYDLPDPDTYRDFFRLNPLWDFPTLASTCTYFRGCPINKLDIAIAYDLPELLGKFRRQRESIISAQNQQKNQQQQQSKSSKPK